MVTGNILIAAEEFAAIGTRWFLNWSGEIIIPPDWNVRGFALFNAGVAVNSLFVNLQGILIPVANIQRL